ncbi:MAG: 4-(cytidine 5'-diphospho)-2-C-methyl-D-erythritol kinase [Pseudomonadota bacterium]
MIVETARAKVNLALHVTSQTQDGYHCLDSLVAFADVGDRLTFSPADHLNLSITGPFAGDLSPNADNLVLRAARLMGAPPVLITLEKNLPVASGIGGGSADAAATIRGLSRLTSSDLPGIEQQVALGADVPVCIFGHACRMQGIGEVIEPLEGFSGLNVVLVNPGVAVSTRDVFDGLSSKTNSSLPDFVRFDDLCLSELRNDLERPARAICPEIDDVLSALSESGSYLARISGSGATCYGVFATEENARHAADHLSQQYPDWWVTSAALR